MAFIIQREAEPNIGAMIGQGIAGGMQQRALADFQQQMQNRQREQAVGRLQNYFQTQEGQAIPEDERAAAIAQLQGMPAEIARLGPENKYKVQAAQAAAQGKTNQLQQKNAFTQQQNDIMAESTRQTLKKLGYPVPDEHISGTPSTVYTNIANQASKADKSANKAKDLARLKPGFLSSLEDMEKLIPYTGSVWVPGKAFAGENRLLHPTALQKRAEFDTLRLPVQQFFESLLTKSQISARVFFEIKNHMPASDLPEAVNKGRLAALRKDIERYIPDAETNNATTATTSTTSRTVKMIAPNGREMKVPIDKVNEMIAKGAKKA